MAQNLLTMLAVVAIAIFTTGIWVEVEAVALNHKGLKLNPTIIPIGPVQGKSYFLEKNFLSWTQAKANCSGQGLALATIETVEQRDFLKSRFSVIGTGSFWTAGRDALSIEQFVWDHSGHVQDNIILPFYPPSTPLSCLYYRVSSATSQSYYSYGCSYGLHFLCQTH